MEKIGYHLLRSITWIIHLLPLRVNYIFSDFFYIFGYHVIRYRRNVVNQNLSNSFPEKTKKELDLIAKKFYKHFSDSFVETLYFDRMSVTEAKNCVKYLNPELLNSYLDQGRQVVTFLGHYNNWEWFCNLPFYASQRCYGIYKQLKSKSFEYFYFKLRSRFGVIPLEKSDTYRKLFSDHQNGIPSFSGFLVDQTPKSFEIQHWVTFLNQETPVVLGAEKIARKLDTVVLFQHSKKVRRGKYEVEFELVADHAGACPTFEITDKCTHLLEQQIIDNPEFWLWSHKRWKHKREMVVKNGKEDHSLN
ncbi:MAG: lysophospholipid acyltransferase family protein [Mariniphaga sp.]|nr:lysophospholipid acyltransferase family protein [Mariniphaga sp.]